MADLLPASACSRRPHVVAVPLAAQGHMTPMMRLCRKLASLGVLVTFVNADAIHDRIVQVQKDSGEPGEEEGKRTDIRMVRIPVPGISLSSDFRVSFEGLFMAMDAIGDALGELVESISQNGPRVTCIISDFCTSVATQKVADKFGIPRVALMSASQSSYVYWMHVSDGRIRLEDVLLAGNKGLAKAANDLVGDLPGLPALRYEDLQTFKHIVDDNEFIYHFMCRQMQNFKDKCKSILINNFYELEGPVIDLMSKQVPVYLVGPLLEELEQQCNVSLWQEEEGCLQWLEKQLPNSVLYISFGSITTLSALQFQEIILGLEASQQRFLLSLRPDLVEGAYKLVEEFISRTNGLACIVTWAPQIAVLSHSSVGGFLTHCGWNSTIESIANGVPMLCWPYFADQFLNRRFIVDEWRVGLAFQAADDGVVRREEVERGVRALMSEETGREMRRKAMEVSERVRLGDLCGFNIGRFVEDMKKW